MQRFTEPKVWQRAQAITIRVYHLTRHFPAEERFGLTSQIRRAMVSVGANIAEGSKRRSRADYARFLNMAEGSLAEVEHVMLVGRALGFTTQGDADRLQEEMDEVGRMLHALRSQVDALE